MDNINWRPTQQGGEPAMDAGNWRSELQPLMRHRIVNRIMETLKKHYPFSGQEGLQALKKIAARFEEKIYSGAISQADYLKKISRRMHTMDVKSQSGMSNAPSAAGNSSKPPDPGIHGMPSQIPNQAQLPLPTNQPQACQQLLSHNMQNNIVPELSAGLPSAPQNAIPNVSGQNSNVHNISGVSQNQVGNSTGQGLRQSNIISNTQRQFTTRQQIVSQQQQQQQQPQNPQQYLYRQQLQQQQPQNMLESTQLHSSQQSIMPAPMMQSAPHSGIQHNQQPSVQQQIHTMLQQHPQSQPASVIHQQQQLMGQPPSATNIQQNQLIGQQNHVGDMQQQQQQRLITQQNNIPNLQQQQQQLMAQQSVMPNMHQQQLGPQTNVSGLHQQAQLIGIQSGNSETQTNQHPMNMLQQSKIQQKQIQQGTPNLLPTQGQQQQTHLSQPQQLMSQIQSQPGRSQQLLQQQPNSSQRDMQQRLQASGPFLQPQNVFDQQKQLYQSQREILELSSTSLDSTAKAGHVNGGDWQEEIYQKIKVMKEMYFPELNDIYQKVLLKLQQQDALQLPRSEQLEKLKMFKPMLERVMSVLLISKANIPPNFKDKLVSCKKQIINIITTNRPRKPLPSLQQGELPLSHMHSMQQPQSHSTQVQSRENQVNPQLQSMNLESSVGTIQQNNMANLQHSTTSSLSGVSTAQQNMMNSLPIGYNLDSGQGNALSSLQQVSVQKNHVSSPQQANINNFSSQSGINVLQQNVNTHPSNSNMLQQQHLKNQEQFMQKQQKLQLQQQQQLHQQAKLPSQLQANQMPQLQQMNDVNDMKIRQGIFQQHHTVGQRAAYPHQQLKLGSPFPISSPQLIQGGSPQIPQNSSPQIDQQNMLSSIAKAGTPLQSANLPFVVPSPTPMAPSPMPADTEKPSVPVMSTLPNTGNNGHHQQATTIAPAQSLAIGTPGISSSPLLEVAGLDGSHGNGFILPGKPSVMEQPLEHLVKTVKLLSSKALSSSVSDIGSVVSMIDRIAGSAPGNGSRAAVGEDLVCMTKSRLQTRNFIRQDGTTGSKRLRRYTSAMPLNVVSSAGSANDSFKWLTGSETSDLESTATSGTKRLKIEANNVLLEEMREINQRLIDTVVNISDEDVDPTVEPVAAAEGGEGIIVKCSFSGIALSPNLKSQFTSAQLSPIQPLRLLVPTNYPNCSPVLLDKFPVEVGKEYEDLSVKAKSRFSISLQNISEPMSLGEIARTWDACARTVISDYVLQSGGGSFTSKYGTWESCLSAT